MKAATIYSKAGLYFGHASSETTDGVQIATPPYLCIADSTGDEDLGQFAITLLNSSLQAVPHPKQNEWNGIIAPLLALAKAETWNSFQKGALCCFLEAKGRELSIYPHGRLESGKGFKPLESKKVIVDFGAETKKIGHAVCDAFLRCED